MPTQPWGFSTDQVAPDQVSIRDPLTTSTAVRVSGSLGLSSGTVGLATSTTDAVLGTIKISTGTPIYIGSGTVTLSSAIAISSGTITLSSAIGISSGLITLLASTAAIGAVVIGSSYAATPVYITTADVQKVSSSPGTLWSLTAYTTSTGTASDGLLGVIRLYNAATSGTTAGQEVVYSAPVAVFATSTTGILAPPTTLTHNFGPRGMAFSVACSVDVATNSTGTTPLANAKITALYNT